MIKYIYIGDKRVIGISHLFLSMDFSGSIFSTLALGSCGSTKKLHVILMFIFNSLQ